MRRYQAHQRRGKYFDCRGGLGKKQGLPQLQMPAHQRWGDSRESLRFNLFKSEAYTRTNVGQPPRLLGARMRIYPRGILRHFYYRDAGRDPLCHRCRGVGRTGCTPAGDAAGEVAGEVGGEAAKTEEVLHPQQCYSRFNTARRSRHAKNTFFIGLMFCSCKKKFRLGVPGLAVHELLLSLQVRAKLTLL